MPPRRAAHAVAAHRMGSGAGPRCRRTPRRRRGSRPAAAAPGHRGPHGRRRHRRSAAPAWAPCRTAGPGVGGWAMSWAARPWSGPCPPPFSPGPAPRPRGPPRVPDDTEPPTIARRSCPERENGSRSAYRHGGRRALLVDGVGGRAMRDSEKPRDETSRNTLGNATKRPSDGKILENGEQNAGAWHGWLDRKLIDMTSPRPRPPPAVRRIAAKRSLDAAERRPRRRTGPARPARDGDHQLRRRQPLRLVSLPSHQPTRLRARELVAGAAPDSSCGPRTGASCGRGAGRDNTGPRDLASYSSDVSVPVLQDYIDIVNRR